VTEKPANLIYGLDDKPPLTVLLLLSLQHIFLMSSTLVLPVVLVTEIGGTSSQVRAIVGLTMIACGLGTIFQAMNTRFFGSGYLCPNLCGPNFFASSMEAAWLGGLPLMRGMTIVAGVAEALFARVVHRLKFLFPAEITGMVVLMVAEGLIPLGVSKFLGINYEGEPIKAMNLLVATITLLAMIGSNVWGKGRMKLYSVLVGMACGYVLSIVTGLMSTAELRNVIEVPWIALPFTTETFDIAFRWSLLPPFLIVSVTGALKSFGNLIMCEKVNDAAWVQPDVGRIGKGLMADSFCVTVSGLLGGMASDTSASNVALSNASGATSRRIAYVAGGLFIVLGFSPKTTAILSVMPTPLMGAILVYVTSFMVVSGMGIILGSGMDTQKTFVVGVSLIFGLSVDIMPSLYVSVYPWLKPLFGSSLTLSTVMAVLLNQALR
jgi:xanthine permease XanP